MEDKQLSPARGGDDAYPEDQERGSASHSLAPDYPAPVNRQPISDDERAMTVRFGPNCATQEEFAELFKQEGFKVFSDIRLARFGTVRLPSEAQAQQFIKHFNDFTFKGQQLYAQAMPPQQYVKTLHITGLEENGIDDRKLFYILSPYGFIRRISSKKGFTFVEFDTIADARRARSELKAKENEYPGLRVSYARSEHKPDFSNLRIPLSDLIPLSHPFWYKLQDMMYDR